MRTLLLMRHAKSAWDTGADDHDRPLNKRGREAAATMGQWLTSRGQAPDRVLSSSARRARSTAERAAESGSWHCPVTQNTAIYEASAPQLVAVLATAPAEAERLLLIGHEPGMSQLVELLCGARVRFPTAAIARLELSIETWGAIHSGCGELTFLVSPRLLDPALGGAAS